MSGDRIDEKSPGSEKIRGRSRKKGNDALNESVKKILAQDAQPEKPPVNKKCIAIIAVSVVVAVAAIGTAAYMLLAQRYQDVYFPNTTINGLNASGQTADEVRERIRTQINGYVLTLEERGSAEGAADAEELIYGADIDLHPEFDGTLEALLSAQQPLSWGKHLWEREAYTIETMVVYDNAKLDTIVDNLSCMDPEQTVKPTDAYCSDYIEGVGYEIVAETGGNTPDPELLKTAVAVAISNLQTRLSLEEQDVYQKPSVTAEDEALNARVERWNRVVNTVVTYRFGSTEERLDGSETHSWLTADSQGNPQVETECVESYVAALAKKYNTAYTNRTLMTTYGSEVTVAGPYGWRIDQSVEAAALAEIIASGESQEREPVYSQTGASHDGYDFGDTYVEINLSAQHLYYYVDGSLLVESDFVSGNEARNMSTPTGLYPLTYKQRNATLRGEGYATPVSYWMPFNGGVGMHDASWRSSFGGNIYKTNGSHGCINLPASVAKTIYENISAGTPVIVYQLAGTESSTKTTTKATTAAQTTAAETTAAETTVAPVEEPTQEETVAETEAETNGGSPVQEAGASGMSGGPGVAQESTASGMSGGPGVAQETTAAEMSGGPGVVQKSTAIEVPGPGTVQEDTVAAPDDSEGADVSPTSVSGPGM